MQGSGFDPKHQKKERKEEGKGRRREREGYSHIPKSRKVNTCVDCKQEPEFHKPEVQSQTRQLGSSWQGDLCCFRTPDVLVSFLLLPGNIVNKGNKFIVIQMLTFPSLVAWLCWSWVCNEAEEHG